jgi:hypothetical protein
VNVNIGECRSEAEAASTEGEPKANRKMEVLA